MKHFYSFDTGILNHNECSNVALSYAPFRKEETVLFRESYFAEPSVPWEARFDNGYPNVFWNPLIGKYVCYHTLCTKDEVSTSTPLTERAAKRYIPSSERITSLAYLESEDGLHWERPDLGLVSFQGNTHNNLLIEYCHGAGVFYDEAETDPEKKFKLAAKFDDLERMASCFSADGIHWSKPHPWNHNPAGDTLNCVFRDKKDGRFKCITRIWKGSLRIPAVTESEDFLTWSEPVECGRGEGPGAQIYSMPVLQLDGMYLGFASLFHEGDRMAERFDTVNVDLRYSPDLHYFQKCVWEDGAVFIENGPGQYPDGAPDAGCVYASLPVEIDGRYYIYYMGGNGHHTDFRETSLLRGSVEKDRFTFFHAKRPGTDALLRSSNLRFSGEELYLDMDAEEDFRMEAVMVTSDPQKVRGSVIEGYEGRVVRQEDNPRLWRIVFDHSLAALEGRFNALRLTFRGAKIYGILGDFTPDSVRYNGGVIL